MGSRDVTRAWDTLCQVKSFRLPRYTLFSSTSPNDGHALWARLAHSNPRGKSRDHKWHATWRLSYRAIEQQGSLVGFGLF